MKKKPRFTHSTEEEMQAYQQALYGYCKCFYCGRSNKQTYMQPIRYATNIGFACLDCGSVANSLAHRWEKIYE